jgi:intracellular multiplication protein IcmQ
MEKDLLSNEQITAILDALDEALRNGPWEKSNFLRVMGKNLQELRDNFAKKANAPSSAQIKSDSLLAHRQSLRESQQEVFVSVYCADGTNIQSWEKIVMNLPRQMISRPIYADETQVKDLIKSKVHKENEAYVGIFVNKTDILHLSADKTLVDKLGSSLLALKDKSLDLENITRFVHMTGVYNYSRGRLTKES